MENRIFCMGDIHGAHKALKQCLERSNFDYENDTLIQLGDVCDGWSEVYECVEELLKIKNLIAIKGNHDDWFLDFIKYGQHGVNWQQGGLGTLKSYCKNLDKEWNPTFAGYITNLIVEDIPETHREFFKNQKLYHIDYKNRFFVHGGFDRTQFVDYLAVTAPHDFYWDRELWEKAQSCIGNQKLKTANEFSEIFIGHTATEFTYKDCKPVSRGGVTNLDQGAGWSGKLTMMNIDTKEYLQSDNVKDLYPNDKGR